MQIHPVWNNFPSLKEDLPKVIQLIDQHIKIRDTKIRSTLKEVVHAGGKMLRPAYSLLCHEIGPEKNKEKAIAIAAALETLHMATLIHDDVIDDAATRRGQATLQKLHDNKFAIYAGDYLFSMSFTILSKYSSSLSHLEYNSRSMEKILIGELNQLHSRFQSPDSVKSYLSRISGKTAQLFAVSCYTGAVESKATRRQTRNAWNMGHYIGMAFQIIDDILDYQGDKDTIGKPVMADVQQGVYTLPLIYAMQGNRPLLEPILAKDRPFNDEDLAIISKAIAEQNGIEKASKLAERYINKALKELSKLPDGDYKETLYDLTNQMLKRTT